MTEVGELPATAGEAVAPSPADGRRRRWRIAAAVTAAAVVIAGLAVYVYWRDNARELSPYGGVTTGYTAGKVGRTVYVDAAVQPRYADHEQLDVRSLSPRVTSNTADATITLLLCRRGSASGIGLTLSTTPYCTSAQVFRPGPVDLGFPVAQVIYAVTARRAGVVRIEGCDIFYAAGSRNGTQHVGAGFIDHVHPSH